MVRSEGGILYDWFKEMNQIAIGWHKLAEKAISGATRQALQELYRQIEPQTRNGTIISGASQVWRFVNEMQIGEWVLSYSPTNRTYLIGQIESEAKYDSQGIEQNAVIIRQVKWKEQEIPRDKLSQTCRNSLGAISTIFELPETVLNELLSHLEIQSPKEIFIDDFLKTEPEESNLFQEIEVRAIEQIKDIINRLTWDDMQKLVAGVLRSMGYRTQISPQGADRGKDIIASPDGFGFEHPRIIVEVKHRNEVIGSQHIRSFLGGRHKDDRGLYVSTGGFSKDARYEAERAAIPLVLWTLDELTRTLLQHYEVLDLETKTLVPLKKVYLPI